MSRVPARVAADAEAAMAELAQLAAAASAPAVELTPELIEPPAPAPAPAPVEPPPAPAPAPVPVDVQQELARIQQQLRTQDGRLSAALNDNDELRRQLEEARRAPAPAPAPPTPPASLISDKEREDYGEDLITLIGKVFDERIGSRLDDLTALVRQTEGRVAAQGQQLGAATQTVQRNAQQQYLHDLEQLVPDWQALNTDQKFLDWLGEVDIVSGRERGEMLLEAHNRLETGRVAHIFQLFKQVSGTAPAAPGTPSTPAAETATIDPLSLAAPATNAAAPPPSQPVTGPIYKASDIDELYERKLRGKISKADFEAEERKYFAALAEGRVAANA